MGQVDKEALYAELDALPEMVIRSRLAGSVWGDDKSKLVELYLEEKAAERARVVYAEQTAIARSAKNAAWVAAFAALVAALAALLAYVL